MLVNGADAQFLFTTHIEARVRLSVILPSAVSLMRRWWIHEHLQNCSESLHEHLTCFILSKTILIISFAHINLKVFTATHQISLVYLEVRNRQHYYCSSRMYVNRLPVFPTGILWDLWRRWCHINLHIHDVIASSLHSDEFGHFRFCSTLWTVTYCNTTECPINLFTLYFVLS